MGTKRPNTEDIAEYPEAKRQAMCHDAERHELDYLRIPRHDEGFGGLDCIPSLLVQRDLYSTRLTQGAQMLMFVDDVTQGLCGEIAENGQQLQGYYSALKQRNDEAHAVLMTFKDELAATIRDCGDTKAFFKKVEESYLQMIQEIPDLEKTVEENLRQQNEAKAREDELAALYAKVNEMFEKTKKLGTENQQLKAEVGELDEQLREQTEMARKLEEAKLAHEMELAKIAQAREEAEQENMKLDSKIAEISNENAELEAELAQLLNETDVVVAETINFTKKSRSLSQETAKIDLDIELKEIRCDEFRKKLDEIIAELIDVQESVDAKETEKAKLAAELETQRKLRHESEVAITLLTVERELNFRTLREKVQDLQDLVAENEFSSSPNTSEEIAIPQLDISTELSPVSPFAPAHSSTTKNYRLRTRKQTISYKEDSPPAKVTKARANKAEVKPILAVRAHSKENLNPRSNMPLPIPLDAPDTYVPIHRRPRNYLA